MRREWAQRNRGNPDDHEIEDPSSEEDTDDNEFRFTESPGW